MNSFNSKAVLRAGGRQYEIYRLESLDKAGLRTHRLPYSLRVLLENLLRHENGKSVTAEDIKNLANWDPKAAPSKEIAFMPARVLMQDFTGVPAIVDLAAMRDAMQKLGFSERSSCHRPCSLAYASTSAICSEERPESSR